MGNPLRGDDGLGPALAARVGGRVVEPTRLAEALADLDAAVVVDLVAGLEPGEVRVWPADVALERLAGGESGSHGFGLLQGLALARALGWLPPTCWVVGLGGRGVGLGDPLSTDGLEAAERKVRALLEGA